MRFKLIIAFVDDSETEIVLEAGREAGATGATIVTSCRGEGLERGRTFFGLDLTGHRDMLLFVVEEHLSQLILERIAKVGAFDEKSGTGIALQIDVEDAVGLRHQIETIQSEIEDQI